ncbi:MAG: putative Ig domain-containing protein [Opitutaceae bacterium]|nr:putative Ig domain-containing protein [Opitutaceae bacterium]
MNPIRFTRILSLCGLLAALLVTSAGLRAQAQFAGTYIGTLNTRVTVPVVGTIESGFGAYVATVTAAGAFDLNGGGLTGTVSASGAVTITGGTAFSLFGITSATITGTTLSSAYGPPTAASNNTSSYRINPSTGFTPAPGGGGGGGGGPTPIPSITSPVQASGTVGVAFTYQITATNSPTSFGASGLPPGLSINTATGLISGTPTASGSFNVNLSATNAGGSTAAPYTFAISPGGGGATAAPVVTSATGTGNVGTPYSYQIIATNSPTSYAATSLPAGLTVNATTGLISGTPTVGGTFQVNITATNAIGSNTGRLTLTVGTAPVVNFAVAPTNLVGYRNRVGQVFQFTVTGSNSGAVWGTDVYTDDSTVARAAVHAGVLAVGETRTVTVTILPGRPSYAASTRNGVASASWGSWSGSYSFAGAGAVVGVPVATSAPALAPGFVVGAGTLAAGGRFVCPINVTGGGTYTYQWYRNNVLIAGATANPYIVASVTAADAGTYTVDVRNALGTVRLTAGSLTVGAAGSPVIALHPISKTVLPGATVTFAASATGANLTYQWFRNNIQIAGETGAILLRNNVNAADAGTYTVRVTNAAGSVTTTGGVLTLSPNASRPANISVRTNVATGALVTPGFVLQGTGTKRVLIRAVGPGLAQFGLGGVMADPKFTVFQGQTQIATNDDWSAANIGQAFTATGAFGLGNGGSKDAALVTDLPAGRDYTVQVTNATGSGGIVLIEVYDADALTGTTSSKLVNVSVRGQTAPGDDVLTLGLVIGGTGQRTLLVRGIGPGLAAFGVPGTVVDPRLQIYDSQQRAILANDDWGNADFVSELGLATTYVGAFALANNSRDAATLSLVDPGAYTIQVSGAAASPTGEALVEVYEVP